MFKYFRWSFSYAMSNEKRFVWKECVMNCETQCFIVITVTCIKLSFHWRSNTISKFVWRKNNGKKTFTVMIIVIIANNTIVISNNKFGNHLPHCHNLIFESISHYSHSYLYSHCYFKRVGNTTVNAKIKRHIVATFVCAPSVFRGIRSVKYE